jgi:hypothetical protein
MPARSEAQRRWAYAVKGAAWAEKHHFDTKGPLPENAHGKALLDRARGKKQRRKRRR